MREITPNERLLSAIRSHSKPKLLSALAEGADPNSRPDNSYHTCFGSAINGYRWDMTVILAMLEAGADPNCRISKGSIPVYSATNQSQMNLLTLLLDFGADPNLRRQKNGGKLVMDTALHEAVGCNRREFVDALLKAGADPLLEDGRNKKLPIDRAGQKFAAKRVRDMLEHYTQLPRVDVESDISKDMLLAEDERGYCALDNPVVWRQWEAISQKLAARGESFCKDELLGSSSSGQVFLKTAIEARQLGLVLHQMHHAGEVLRGDDFANTPELSKQLESPYVLRHLLDAENLHALGSSGFQNLLQHLPDSVRDQLPNRHTILANLSRSERAHQRAFG